MDQRHSQIKEGAGLEESRLNRDLLDFLQNHSTYIFGAIIVISGGWAGWNFFQRRAEARYDTAFTALNEQVESVDSPSPASIRDVIDQYTGVGSVGEIASIRLAQLYMDGARRGLFIGATLNPDGTYNQADRLTPDDRRGYIQSALTLFRDVADRTQDNPAAAVLALHAAMGAAAAAESLDDADNARAFYDRAVRIAETAGLPAFAQAARQRAQTLDTLVGLPQPLPLADLPRFPGEFRPGDAPPAPTESAPIESTPTEPAQPTAPTQPPATGADPALPLGFPDLMGPTPPAPIPAPVTAPIPAPATPPATTPPSPASSSPPPPPGGG